MSDANSQEELAGLDYLIRVRPDAIQNLFSFINEAGRHLDPRTRLLISIATQVMDFSAAGLRRDIPRALHEGATLDQVIDTILCCLPACGLTRVVDAIDLLRSLTLENDQAIAAGEEAEEDVWMDLPEGQAGELEEDEAPQWIPVMSARDLDSGQAHTVELGGEEIVIFNVDGELRALANTCPHLGARLDAGAVEGGVVTCPWHGWRFDLRSGACLNQPHRSVRTYPVRVADEEIQIQH